MAPARLSMWVWRAFLTSLALLANVYEAAAEGSASASSSGSGSSSGSSSGTSSDSGDASTKWMTTLEIGGLQAMLTQRMTMEFLLIAYGVDVDTNKKHLKESIYTFDMTLQDMITGNEAKNIIAPPSSRVEHELDIISQDWAKYRPLLETNMDSVKSDSLSVLAEVESENLKLMHDSELVIQYYKEYAAAAGQTLPDMSVGIAERQRVYAAKMFKEALFVGLHLRTQHYLESLTHTMHLFMESHEGLVRGVDFVGLKALTKHCTLNEMVKVNHYWDEMQPLLQEVLDQEAASNELLVEIEHIYPELDHEIEVAVHLFQHDDDSCDPIPNIKEKGWIYVIEEAGMQRMLGQKASRLLLQIAKGVHVGQSRVDLDTTLAAASQALRNCIEGKYGKIPAPMTKPIVQQLIAAWDHFELFDESLRAAAAMPEISAFEIHKIAELSDAVYVEMTHATEMYVHEALKAKPELESIVLELADRQLTLLQKMSKEALLISLGDDVQKNREAFKGTTEMFELVHWELLYGVTPGGSGSGSAYSGARLLAAASTASSSASSSGTSAGSSSSSVSGGMRDADELVAEMGVPRTEDSCTLNQMLAVLDSYTELKHLLEPIVARSIFGEDEMHALDQIDVLSPVAHDAMFAAVLFYVDSNPTCDFKFDAAVWEMGLREVGRASQYFQKASKEFYLGSMGIVLYGNDDLHHTIYELDHELDQIKFGNSTADIPPPPTQPIAEALFVVSDKWAHEKTLLHAVQDKESVDAIVDAEALFMDAAAVLSNRYISSAWEADKTVQGVKIALAARQITLIEKMIKEATLIAMHHEKFSIANLTHTLETYEANHLLLLHGSVEEGSGSGSGSARRLAEALSSMEEVPPTTERFILMQMDRVEEKYSVLKKMLDHLIETGEANAEELTEMVSKAHYVEDEMDEALVSYVSHTRTTTSIPVEILAPVPLTSNWDAGRTMRISALLAEALINDEQRVLPGYSIHTSFFDDKCDPETGTQIVLEEVANKDTYVGLGGLGCNTVCESMAFVASSMRMPMLSYECAGNRLSDTEVYPDMTRMGTTTTGVPDIIKELADEWGWSHVLIVSGDPSVYRQPAETLQAALEERGISTDYANSYDDQWDQTRDMMKAVKDAKRRLIFVMGSEAFYRRVICGSILAEANLGITWMSEGTRRANWWLAEDPELLQLAPECTPEKIGESYEGAINFAGLGQPLREDLQKPLTCFSSQTAESFLELIDVHLTEGFPAGNNETEVPHPYFDLKAHAADATCVFMYSVKYLLEEEGKTIDEIRRPDEETYQQFLTYIKTMVDLDGVSGRVSFEGNDKPAYLAVRQVQTGPGRRLSEGVQKEVVVATKLGNHSLNFTTGTAQITNESWQPANPDPPPPPSDFPYVAFQIFVPVLCVCCPALAGCLRSA